LIGRPFRSIASNVPLTILEEIKEGLFQEIENDEEIIDNPWNDETVGPLSSTFWPLSPDNPDVTWNEPLPGRRYKFHKLGSTYTVFWPGGEVKWWDWGSYNDHQNKTIKAGETIRDLRIRPPIILPATNAIRLTVGEEPIAWPERAKIESTMPRPSIDFVNFLESRWRQGLERSRMKPPLPMVSEDKRMFVFQALGSIIYDSITNKMNTSAGAPVLSVSLTGSPTVALKADGSLLSVIFTYDGVSSGAITDARPITFQIDDILSGMFKNRGFSFLHRSPGGQLERFPQWYLNPGPEDVDAQQLDQIKQEQSIVSLDSDAYCTLNPGERFIHNTTILSTAKFHTEGRENIYQVGGRFIYRFNGGEVSWWD
jgi:hypothetical protein